MKLHRHLDCSRIFDSILHPHVEINEKLTHSNTSIFRHQNEGFVMDFYWLLLFCSFRSFVRVQIYSRHVVYVVLILFFVSFLQN